MLLWLRGLDSQLEASLVVCLCSYMHEEYMLSLFDFIYSCLFCAETQIHFDNLVDEMLKGSVMYSEHLSRNQRQARLSVKYVCIRFCAKRA